MLIDLYFCIFFWLEHIYHPMYYTRIFLDFCSLDTTIACIVTTHRPSKHQYLFRAGDLYHYISRQTFYVLDSISRSPPPRSAYGRYSTHLPMQCTYITTSTCFWTTTIQRKSEPKSRSMMRSIMCSPSQRYQVRRHLPIDNDLASGPGTCSPNTCIWPRYVLVIIPMPKLNVAMRLGKTSLFRASENVLSWESECLIRLTSLSTPTNQRGCICDYW